MKNGLSPMHSLFFVTGCRNDQFEVGIWKTLTKIAEWVVRKSVDLGVTHQHVL